ncbi:DUF2470 domain-containing protein [Micromonospora sp. WMMD1082]|uniref:DUF2470 domain-containing protein n=1 Tax=Micromonospora sp. WMMD1082 TaxID=3016104 RepID=UPI00241791B6|nr:DUF2470 domain-containing protein [Micromonospora sp. WMMD1082]MDG4797161.1 DUF2470 domain-containing protein [Micromonospora sp. WMMD1082]
MGKTLPAVTTGTPAERLRTLLAVTDSLTLRTPRHHADLVGRHTVAADGRLRMALPARAEVARHLFDVGETPALIELTDLAPLPVRDRVRARATLTGWLTLDELDGDDLTTVLDLAAADLVDADGDASVDPDELAAARPDPLAPHEADLLRHLHEQHPEAIHRLGHLVPAEQRGGARRIHPLRLDRHGIVLRLELPTHHRDVRIAFAAPLAGPEDAAEHLARLVGPTPSCRACAITHP